MTSNEKILGHDRRNLLVKLLKDASNPIPGRELGEITNVSRQVISGDITLLKAKGEPIMATSRGYVYMHPMIEQNKIEKVIVCNHTAMQTEEELNILVDHGITVKDVKSRTPDLWRFNSVSNGFKSIAK